MKRIVTGIILFACHCGMAQIAFEPGYIISSDGKRTECEIKNMDWKSNPTSFEYRVNGTEATGGLETISEFGITKGSVFRRFTVLLDRSSNDVESLTMERNPQFKQETLFLRFLVSGKAELYMWDDQGLIRFFYRFGQPDVSQLVYKRYNQKGKSGYPSGYVLENEQYKQQLLMELTCPSISKKDVQRLKYERPHLMKFFERYNRCSETPEQTK